MDSLIEFAFNDLILSIDQFIASVPTNELELSQSCVNLENIVFEYKELVNFIEKAISLNEE